LEIDSASAFLQPSDCLADFGCGDGRATVQYAKKVRECFGFERSNTLLMKAKETLERSGVQNLRFLEGNILEQTFSEKAFDVVITQRLLSN
jgi:ubiquinone/menaquinone biosynthesis C-methylase UbiE